MDTQLKVGSHLTQLRRGKQNGNGTSNGNGHAATFSLLVCKGFSGEVCRVEVPAASTVAQALASIADQIGYESPDYDKIGLYNMTQDFEYTAFDHLNECGTVNGDLLIMVDGESCFKE